MRNSFAARGDLRPPPSIILILAEPRLLGRGEGLGNCLYVTCSRGMFDCVTYNRTDITLRNARPHMNNTEPLDLPSELLRD